nr:hypothetical protein BaRGS_011775 [Batillaria attramentaria]
MHKYESVAKLKQEVCNKLQVPFYAVDLKHGNTPLQEQHNLRTSRLRDSDTVQAVVLPNRMRVKVRLFSGHWEDIVVDDLTVSTVRQLKLFTESLVKQRCASTSGNRYGEHAERGPVSTSASLVEFSVIFNGRVLSDEDTLREAGVMMNGKLVLVQAEKNCFTAVCGLVPIFLSHASGMFRREIVMSDGKMFYFGEASPCSSSADNVDSGIVRSRSDTLNQSTSPSVTFETFQREAAEKE